MSTYTQALTLLAPLLAVLWAVHSAIYWTANTVVRTVFGYVGPTVWFSAWATVLAVHAALSLFVMAILLLRYESSPDSSS